MKQLPYKFPDQRSVIHEDAQQTLALPPGERLGALLAFVAEGEQLFSAAPNRDAALRLRAGQRLQRRQALRGFLSKHGC